MTDPRDAECRDGYLLRYPCHSCDITQETPHAPDLVTALVPWSVRPVNLCRLCGQHAGHPAHRKDGRG